MNNYEDNKAKHNVYAQAFLDNSEKLQQMAEIISRGFENAKANEQTYGSRESGVRFAKSNYYDYSKSFEEYDVDGKKQAYNAQRIKMSALPRAHFSVLNKQQKTGNISLQADEITIADLHALVKQFDNNFNPPEASKVVDKDGKPLVVYHHYINDLLRNQNILYTENNRDIHDLLNAQGREVPESQAMNVSTDRIAPSISNSNTYEENNLNGPKSKDDTIYDIDLLLDIRDQICYIIISSRYINICSVRLLVFIKRRAAVDVIGYFFYICYVSLIMKAQVMWLSFSLIDIFNSNHVKIN